jgi:hypothetical protein
VKKAGRSISRSMSWPAREGGYARRADGSISRLAEDPLPRCAGPERQAAGPGDSGGARGWRRHLGFSLGRACLRVAPSGAPELGAAAQARLRHRPRTMPELWRRAEDHRRPHRCAGERAHPDPSGPFRARPTTLAGTGAGPASRGLTAAQPIPFERTDAPSRGAGCAWAWRLPPGVPSARHSRVVQLAHRTQAVPKRGDLHRGKHGAEPPDRSQLTAAFKLDRKGGLNFLSSPPSLRSRPSASARSSRRRCRRCAERSAPTRADGNSAPTNARHPPGVFFCAAALSLKSARHRL